MLAGLASLLGSSSIPREVAMGNKAATRGAEAGGGITTNSGSYAQKAINIRTLPVANTTSSGSYAQKAVDHPPFGGGLPRAASKNSSSQNYEQIC